MTISQKILARAAGLKTLEPGDIINAPIDVTMIHDSLGILAVNAFMRLPVDKVWDPDKIVVVFDHRAPATNIDAANNQASIRRFIRDQGIRNFYDMGRGGICHQVLHEQGHVKPWDIVVGADSHTNTYGAIGAFAVGVGSTEMAGVFAQGELWFKVPETIRVNVEGSLGECVMGKDVILHVIGMLGANGATYKAVEFTGTTITRMSMDGRFTICNMSTEMGAKNAIIEPDETTLNYLEKRISKITPNLHADTDADYIEEYEVDCSALEPSVAAPFSPDNVKPVTDVEGIDIDQAFIGSCTNGRMEDLRTAAQILKGHKISDSVRLVVVPASQRIWAHALKEGLLEIFQEAGANVCTPSCGPCTGADKGILGANEVCIATINRNFVGRMGDPSSEIYLANPYTVAASALKGKITDPRPFVERRVI
jgi:3-isopropylmalate/(R)-2-methylmalate dehydratase large subunit